MKKKTNKKILKFIVFVITILTANLLGDYAGDFLTSFKDDYKPLMFELPNLGDGYWNVASRSLTEHLENQMTQTTHPDAPHRFRGVLRESSIYGATSGRKQFFTFGRPPETLW